MSQTPDPTEDLFEEASGWWRRAQLGAPEDLSALEAWLVADPRHAEAFAYVRATYEGFDEHPASPELLRLRTRTLKRAEQIWRRRLDPAGPTRRLALGALVAGVGAAVATPVALMFDRRRGRVLATGLGEQTVTQLEDGSKITLDANSQVRVNFTKSARDIHLLGGRSYFEVAKDATRPFNVHALRSTVTAVGTAFTVELRRHAVSVALFEGRVNVTNQGHGGVEVLSDIKPNEKILLKLDRAETPRYEPIVATRELGWRDRELFFDQTPMAEVADRMNDYSRRKIVVEGQARDYLVSGMYLAGQTDAFIDALDKFYPVEVEYAPGAITIRPRRNSAD